MTSLNIVGDRLVLDRPVPWYWRMWFPLPLIGPWARARWTARNTRTIIDASADGRTITLDRPW